MQFLIKFPQWLEMEKTLSRIRNLRARRKLSLPASPSPGLPRPDRDSRLGSEDDLVEWSVRIRSLIPDLQTASRGDDSVVSNNNNIHHHEVKKSNSERRKVVQWDPTVVTKFPGRAQSEKSARKKRSGSVSVISERVVTSSGVRRDRELGESHAPSSASPPPSTPQLPAYPYPRHGSLPHAFRNGNHRRHLGKLSVALKSRQIRIGWWNASLSQRKIEAVCVWFIFFCKEKMTSEEYLCSPTHSHVDLSSISSAQGDYRDLAGTESMPHLYSASQHIHSPYTCSAGPATNVNTDEFWFQPFRRIPFIWIYIHLG